MDARRPDPILERHLLGELPPFLARKAEKILSTPEGQRRLEELKGSDERILRELPPRTAAEQIRRKLEDVSRPERSDGARRGRPWAIATGAALALGASLAVVGVLRPLIDPEIAPEQGVPSLARPAGTDSPTARKSKTLHGKTRVAQTADVQQVAALETTDEDGIRTKGEPVRLRVHLVPAGKGDGKPVLLSDGDTCDPGDIVQVSIPAGAKIFAAVLSLDGNGTVTRHIPELGDSAAPVQAQLDAPHSFQLDAAPGFERFVLFTSDRPFSLREAQSMLVKAGGTGPVPRPAAWNVQSLRLVKREGTLR